MEHMFITNDVDIAKICDEVKIERVWIDLEVLGKAERQGHIDSVKSQHSLDDIKKIKPILRSSKLQVRVNPINPNSRNEINTAIENGADYIMLPMFRTASEVKEFIDYVDKRVKTILLIETDDAVNNLDDILEVSGIDEVHIGLNDLHLCYGNKFMFELLANGTVDTIVTKIKAKGIPFGFGGIARLDGGLLDAKEILGEHYRLGSTRVILSRGFFNVLKDDKKDAKRIIETEFSKIKQYENYLSNQSNEFFSVNREKLVTDVNKIVEEM